VEIAEGYFGLLKPKGKNDHLVGAGVVDAGYQGEILVKVINPYDRPLVFPGGAPIAQLLVLPIVTPQVEEVDPGRIHITASQRGGTGGIHDS
jgi:dUTP pyrophosphatase